MSFSAYRSSYRSGYGSSFPAASAPTPPATGLAAWYKADAGVSKTGSNVTAWTDQSGNGNGLDNSGATSPLFVASAINGLPGIDFNASGMFLQRATSPLSPTSNRSVTVVALPHAGAGVFSPGGTVCTFAQSVGNHEFVAYLGATGGATYGYSNGAAADSLASPPTILNTPVCFQILATQNQVPLFKVNGVSYAQAGGTTVGAADGTDGFRVGGEPNAPTNQFFAGYICELFVHDHVLTAPEQAALAAYVASRYVIAM